MIVSLGEYKVLNTYEVCDDLVRRLKQFEKENGNIMRNKQRYFARHGFRLKYTNQEVEKFEGKCERVLEEYRRLLLVAQAYLTEECETYLKSVGQAVVRGVPMVKYLGKWVSHVCSEGPVVLRQRRVSHVEALVKEGSGTEVVVVVNGEAMADDVRIESPVSENRHGLGILVEIAMGKNLNFDYVPDALFKSSRASFESLQEKAMIKFGDYVKLYAELSRVVMQFGEGNVDGELWGLNGELNKVCEEAARMCKGMVAVSYRLDTERQMEMYERQGKNQGKMIVDVKVRLMEALDDAMFKGGAELSKDEWVKVQQLNNAYLPERFKLSKSGVKVNVDGYTLEVHQSGAKKKRSFVSAATAEAAKKVRAKSAVKQVEAKSAAEAEVAEKEEDARTNAAADVLRDALRMAFAVSQERKGKDLGAGQDVVAVAMAISHKAMSKAKASAKAKPQAKAKSKSQTKPQTSPIDTPNAASMLMDLAAGQVAAVETTSTAGAAGAAGTAAATTVANRMDLAYLMGQD